MVELRYNRCCSVNISWPKLCQDILSVVVSDIEVMVESIYYSNGRSKILEKRKHQDVTTLKQ